MRDDKAKALLFAFNMQDGKFTLECSIKSRSLINIFTLSDYSSFFVSNVGIIDRECKRARIKPSLLFIPQTAAAASVTMV